ncbi:iron export ABC transporter permease subunit FetB [Paenibacillus sp. CGMCC 1.16610]|uniref:Iron export ABC transporter permease subunit FetB n=1 Tax=Paenibacillus anseongense TaxID=2682845 RepID=A0ABW9UA99_9BACL|nr:MULTISPECIES: iron export ABC transporter permease subunit FetB [Paenibacillus]MBA2942098.1 iron export ABC transporter permease subunit FetB [Paenibacillus sp. CGMCC 1.16610]MVQ35931.1 iron export ABC transporter permease subunit FetB [Paenibacillus anseongense]
MSAVALGFTLTFIMITMVLSRWQKLGLEKDIAWGTIRGALQLLFIGYVLHFVFQTEHLGLIIGIIAIMIMIATQNAGKRAKGLTGIHWRIAAAIAITEILTMGLMLGLQIIKPTTQFIIPISGMTIGSSMIVCGLFLNQMNREVGSSRDMIDALLALGATPKQAIQQALQRSVKASMIPTIDGMKTVGLVQLPGMMTGMIIAGSSPIEAVRYQILILFAFTASAAMTGIILSILSYKLWFTKEMTLK